MAYRIDQEVIYKPLNQRVVVIHVYSGGPGKPREYRISFGGAKKNKIVDEADLLLPSATPSYNYATSPSIFHFTDVSNLLSIKKYGLLSWELLEAKKISHMPASNLLSRKLDSQKGLQGYVRLCLRREHKMAYIAEQEQRVAQLIWLSIDPAILRWKTTKFSNRNAAHNEAIIDNNLNTALNSKHSDPEVLIQNALNAKWIRFP